MGSGWLGPVMLRGIKAGSGWGVLRVQVLKGGAKLKSG